MSTDKYFTSMLQDLRKMTNRCRPNMHEPDEQDVSATVTGHTLDNAGTGGELTVTIVKIGSNGKRYQASFNMASLIALARLAQLPEGDL